MKKKSPWFYGMIAGIVAVCILSILSFIRLELRGVFEKIHSEIQKAELPPDSKQPSHSELIRKIDTVLKSLDTGIIVFNTPETLDIGKAETIQLLLSIKKNFVELSNSISAIGEKEGARIIVSDQMKAELIGPSFSIHPLTPTIQFTSKDNDTEWKWIIKSLEPGVQHLFLSISVLLKIDGERIPRSIKVFERDIEIRTTLVGRASLFISNNWQWLWATLLVPIASWYWKSHKDKKT